MENTNVRCWWYNGEEERKEKTTLFGINLMRTKYCTGLSRYNGEAYLVGRQSVLQPAAHAFQGLHGSAQQACPALPAHAG